MLPSTTSPQMPMGSAAKLPLTAADLTPPIRTGATGAPPAAAAGLTAGPGGTPLGSFPSPEAPTEPPWDVTLQPDGSSIYSTKTDPPIIIGVNRPPKLPPSLQPPKQAQ